MPVRKIYPALAVSVLSLACLTACGAGQPQSLPAVTQVVKETVVVTESPAAVEEPIAEEAPASSAGSTFVMPDLVGRNLQMSQDTLQAAGSYVMDQQDASGRGRLQIDDSNWKVCSQDPPPGTSVPLSATVSLAAVKLIEECP